MTKAAKFSSGCQTLLLAKHFVSRLKKAADRQTLLFILRSGELSVDGLAV